LASFIVFSGITEGVAAWPSNGERSKRAQREREIQEGTLPLLNADELQIAVKWDVSNAECMHQMFQGAKRIDCIVSSWNVSASQHFI
jgi:hypothetical protein